MDDNTRWMMAELEAIKSARAGSLTTRQMCLLLLSLCIVTNSDVMQTTVIRLIERLQAVAGDYAVADRIERIIREN